MNIELSITHGNQLLSSARYDVYPDIYAPWLPSLYICSHDLDLGLCLKGHRDICLLCDTFSDILSSNSDSTAVRISKYLGPDEWRRNATPRRPPYFPHPWSQQMRNTTDYIPRWSPVEVGCLLAARSAVYMLSCSISFLCRSVFKSIWRKRTSSFIRWMPVKTLRLGRLSFWMARMAPQGAFPLSILQWAPSSFLSCYFVSFFLFPVSSLISILRLHLLN